METKDKKIQVHTIDNKDIDKFFPAHSEISSKGRKHTVKLFSSTSVPFSQDDYYISY